VDFEDGLQLAQFVAKECRRHAPVQDSHSVTSRVAVTCRYWHFHRPTETFRAYRP
jgi:hypothetical protein